MSNGNPFYVHPGADFGPGLMGLSQTVGRVGEIKKEEQRVQDEKDRIAKLKTEALKVWESGDPDKIRAFMFSNPELAAGLSKAISVKLPGESGNLYKAALFRTAIDFTQAPVELSKLKTQYEVDGLDQNEIDSLANFQKIID